jgi:hypothetical protein
MPVRFSPVVRTMSRLEDFRVRYAVEIKELYEQSAVRWNIPEGQWAGAIYRVVMSRGSPGSRSSSANEISCTLVHPDDFAFALAFRLGCSDALDNFEAKYKVVLHDLALDITHDYHRAMNLAAAVFQEIYGEMEEDGRRRSLLLNFDGGVSLRDWLRALLEQRDAGELEATVSNVHFPMGRPDRAPSWCPPQEALAAYRDLVRLDGLPHRARRLPAKDRARIRHHLRVCPSCQTQLVTGRPNGPLTGELPGAASRRARRSGLVRLRVMAIAGMVGILAWVAWMNGEPQRFVDRVRTILQAVSQARHVAETHSNTPGDSVWSGVDTASRASEPRNYPLTVEVNTAESRQSTSGDNIDATPPTGVAFSSQLPNSGQDTKSVADFSKSQDFPLGKGIAVTAKSPQGVRDGPLPGIQKTKRPKKLTLYPIEADPLYTMEHARSLILESVTTKNPQGVRDRPVSGIQQAKRRKKQMLYTIESDPLYTMEQAQRLPSLGYAVNATQVDSGNERMYQIEVGTY